MDAIVEGRKNVKLIKMDGVPNYAMKVDVSEVNSKAQIREVEMKDDWW